MSDIIARAMANKVTEQLAEITTNITTYDNLKVAIAQGYDWTAAFQAALNNGGHILIPDGDYYINVVTSLVVKNNTTIVMSPNANLRAIGTSATNYNIFNLSDVSNITIMGGNLIGERTTHTGTTGEWGMGIGLYSASNVLIDNVNISNCWGDGIYIGYSSSNNPCKNVTVKDVISDNNRRQGMSIVSVIGLNVLGGQYSNTNGTAPSYGIDIEPDTENDYLQNVNLIGVTTIGNVGGIQVVLGWLAQNAGSKNPVSINIQDYTSINDGNGNSGAGLRFAYPVPSTPLPNNKIYGRVNVKNVSIINPAGRGVDFARWNQTAPRVILEDIQVVNPYSALTTGIIDDQCGFVFHIFSGDNMLTSGQLDFIRCTVVDNRATPLMQIPYYLHTDVSSIPINANIIDPNGTNQANQSNGFINWNYGNGVVKYTNPPQQKFSASNTASNYFGYELAMSVSGVITLPNANNIVGIEFSFRNLSGETLQVRPASGDTILQYGLTSGNDVVLRSAGSVLKIKSIGNNQWVVTDVMGNSAPLGFNDPTKRLYGTAAPTTGTWNLGDYVQNVQPSQLGSTGSMYVIKGWVCTAGGTPGTWLQDRGLTGN